MAAKRARRSVRSTNIDNVTYAVAVEFGKRSWTTLDLHKKHIAITSGLIMFLHSSGFIRKGKTLRPYPNAPLYPEWYLTEKGMRRAERLRSMGLVVAAEV